MITDPRLPDNPIVALNAAFTRLTGYADGEVRGRNCRFLAGAQTEPWASRALHEAVREGKPAFAELLNYRKDGTLFLNAVKVAPCQGDDGSVQHFVGSQMDATGEGTSLRHRRRSGNLLRRLIPQQIEVLRLMAAGLRNKQIAARLLINGKGAGWRRRASEHIDEPYTLRHSTITVLVSAGLPLLTIAQISGTSAEMIERHYGHLASDAAIRALGELAL